MKASKRIILLLAAVLTVALLVVGMTLVTSAEEGDLVTEYGTVPAANANDNFAIFHKAEGASEYTFWASASNPFTYNSAAYRQLTGEVVVLMLKDVDFSAQGTVGLTPCFNSSLVVDLGGNTLTQSTAGTGTFNIYGVALSEDTVVNYTFKNGTVTNVSGKNNEFILTGHTEAELGYNLVTNLTLDHITFTKVANTPYYEQNVVQVNTKPVSASTMNILYNECVIDLTNIAADENPGSAICSDRNTGKQVVYSEFRGGEIRVATMTGFTLINGKNVTFTEGENGYFKFVAPIAETVPTWSLTYEKENIGFGKISQDDTNAYYQPVSLETPYTAITSTYASPYNYPFIIFTKATGATEWSVHSSQGNATSDVSNKVFDPWADNVLTTWWQFDGDVAILMRRDVDFSSRESCTNCIRPNVYLTVDLGGYTLTGTETANGTFFFATKATTNYGGGNGEDHRYWTFKNGTVVTKSAPFVLIGHSVKIEDNPTVNVTFENIVFDRADGATKEQPFVQVNSVTDSALTANISYNDCTFDVRGEFVNANSDVMYLFTVCNNKSSLATTNVTVNGGEIIADTTENLQLVLLGSGCLGSIKFNKGSDGKALQLVLPSGVENTICNSVDNAVHDTASGVAYNFYKVSVGETSTTYQLCPYWLTQYIPKTSVTLSSDLILNIYLPTGRLTAVSVDGEALTLADLPKVTLADGISYYHVTVAQGLTSALDTVELVTEVNIGGTYRASATRTVGIVKYAKSLLADSPTDVEATLVKDMLAYVKAAYNYVGNTSADAAIDAVIGADYTVAPATDTAVSNLEGIDYAALMLNDTPAFIFYPSADYNAEDFKFAIGTTTVSTEVTTIEGKTAILVKTYAYAMTNTVTYTVDGTDVSGKFNLAAYLAAAEAPEANSSDELIALVKALYAYSQSAKAYRAEATA